MFGKTCSNGLSHENFEIKCDNNDFIKKIDVLNYDNRTKGIRILCSDDQTELYGGAIKRYPHLATTQECDIGFSDLNIYEIIENGKDKGGIAGLGMYCKKPDYIKISSNTSDPLYPKYYQTTNIPENAMSKQFKCDYGGKLVGIKGTKQDDYVTSLEFICNKDDKLKKNNVNNINDVNIYPIFGQRNFTNYIIMLCCMLLIIVFIVIIIYLTKNKRSFSFENFVS